MIDSAPASRPIPLLGDLPLEFGQQIEHALDSGFIPLPIAGLDGELQQRLGRGGHRIRIVGYASGERAFDQLARLQTMAAKGDEVTFAADITRALDLQRVVIVSLRSVETAGYPGRFSYDIVLSESPSLPEPGRVESFGGLDDFSIGDLGFDTDILEDVKKLAGRVSAAVDDALDVVSQLGQLASLDGLSIGGLLDPMNAPVRSAQKVGSGVSSAAASLVELFS